MLGLQLADPGFDYSILSELCTRLIASDIEQNGDADKNLDWLSHKSEALSVFDGAEKAKKDSDSLLVAAADVGINYLDELLDGRGLVFAIKHLLRL